MNKKLVKTTSEKQLIMGYGKQQGIWPNAFSSIVVVCTQGAKNGSWR
jgi:hypothetical protein